MERQQRLQEVLEQLHRLEQEEATLTWDHPRVPSLWREMELLGDELLTLVPLPTTPRELPLELRQRLFPK